MVIHEIRDFLVLLRASFFWRVFWLSLV